MTLQELIQKIELAYGVREATTLLVSEIADRIDEINDRPDELLMFANSLRENINELAAAAAADGAIARAAADQRERLAADQCRREQRNEERASALVYQTEQPPVVDPAQVSLLNEDAADQQRQREQLDRDSAAGGGQAVQNDPPAVDPAQAPLLDQGTVPAAAAKADWSGQSGSAGASASFDEITSSDSGSSGSGD